MYQTTESNHKFGVLVLNNSIRVFLFSIHAMKPAVQYNLETLEITNAAAYLQ